MFLCLDNTDPEQKAGLVREDQKETKRNLKCVDFSGKSRFITRLLHMFTGALPVFGKKKQLLAREKEKISEVLHAMSLNIMFTICTSAMHVLRWHIY